MMMEKKLNALADEELENVNGGAENYDTNFEVGEKFTSSLYDEECTVVLVFPSGLCYTVGDSKAAYTNPFSVLQPKKKVAN